MPKVTFATKDLPVKNLTLSALWDLAKKENAVILELNETGEIRAKHYPPSERPQNDMKGDAFIFVDEKHPSYTAVKEGAQREAADMHEEELVAAVKKLALVQSNPAPSSKPKKNNKKAKAKVENERVGKDESGGEGESVVGKEETKEGLKRACK